MANIYSYVAFDVNKERQQTNRHEDIIHLHRIHALTLWSTMIFHRHVDVARSFLDDDGWADTPGKVHKRNAHWLEPELRGHVRETGCVLPGNVVKVQDQPKLTARGQVKF